MTTTDADEGWEALQRHYAEATAWRVRNSRFQDPARPSEATRPVTAPRFEPLSRDPLPARPW